MAVKSTKLVKSASDYFPKIMTLPALKAAAKNCQGCHLYQNATQTVFGEGREQADLMMVGEIPGLKEDLIGQPFTGPAGVFLRKTITHTGLDLEDIYFTNVVKHFKFDFINKRKLHRSPTGGEIKACKPWLEAEIDIIQPKIIVCLAPRLQSRLLAEISTLRSKGGAG